MSEALAIWKRLLAPEHAALLEQAAVTDATDVSAVTRLRRGGHDASLVAAAIDLCRARRKARAKFPNPADLVADPTGVEQATSACVADHKTLRFDSGPVLDLCCGIGGDAMSLARVADVTGIDHDPLRAWMCTQNAGCPSHAVDIDTVDVSGATVHLDPGRRTADGARRHDYADYVPGPDAIAHVVENSAGACVKLGPGVEFDALPLDATRELEMINEHGTLVQAILWTGALARHPGERSATLLGPGASATFHGSPSLHDKPFTGVFEEHLYVPNPALERTELVPTFIRDRPVNPVHPGLGLLTGPEPIDDPWLDRFDVIEQLPWREEKLRAALRQLDAGEVVVRTRGRAIDAERAQRKLRGKGSRMLIVFGLRLGEKRIGVICRRATPPE